MTAPPPESSRCTSWWCTPFRAWPHVQLRAFLALVSNLYSSRASFSVRVSSWQKLAWIADPTVGPRANPSPFLLFDDGSGPTVDLWDGLDYFCDKTVKHFRPAATVLDEFNLLGLHSPLSLSSWNCTSLRTTRNNSWKFSCIRRRCRHGAVVVQETKLRATDPAPVEALVSLVRVSQPCRLHGC